MFRMSQHRFLRAIANILGVKVNTTDGHDLDASERAALEKKVASMTKVAVRTLGPVRSRGWAGLCCGRVYG